MGEIKLRKFRSLIGETGLDDFGASGLTFETDQLVKGKIYTQADQRFYDEHGRNSKPFFVDDNGCSRDIEFMLKNKYVEEVFEAFEEMKDVVIDMSKEFDDKDGIVTCEIAIRKSTIDEFESFIKQNTDIKLGKWIVTECDTCVKYHGEGYVHASIERFETIVKIENSPNHIKTINK